MMERAYTSLGPPLNAQEISEHLAFLPNELPHEYIAFLLTTNGARPRPADWIGDERTGTFSIKCLFGVTRPRGFSNLSDHYASCLAKGIPDFVSIASEDSGNFVLMSLRDDDYGSIHYWDYCADYALDTAETVIRIADSFTDFVHGLVEWSPDD